MSLVAVIAAGSHAAAGRAFVRRAGDIPGGRVHPRDHPSSRPSFLVFTFVWNALCGIPFLMPSFMYGNHQAHHTNDAYGTWSDPEYILHSPDWRLRIAVFLLLPLVYPILIVIRFLVLTPLAMVSRRVNRFVWRHGSSLYVMNESYSREYDDDARARALGPGSACAWVWSLAALVAVCRNWHGLRRSRRYTSCSSSGCSSTSCERSPRTAME